MIVRVMGRNQLPEIAVLQERRRVNIKEHRAGRGRWKSFRKETVQSGGEGLLLEAEGGL